MSLTQLKFKLESSTLRRNATVTAGASYVRGGGATIVGKRGKENPLGVRKLHSREFAVRVLLI